MSLASRAAALRGDDLQHAVAWWWACQAIGDPDIESVSVEDPEGGAFDDVVVRRKARPTVYWQVKNSNYGDTVIDDKWLLSSAGKSPDSRARSPLQHFHDTWRRLRDGSQDFELALVANRSYDHNQPILGACRDRSTWRLDVDSIRDASGRSALGRARDAWAAHLRIDNDELLSFLAQVELRDEGSEATWDSRSKDAMRARGLRSDGEAITVGKRMVRDWVTQGTGPRSRDDIRRGVAENGLLARDGTLVFAVHGIDHIPQPVVPTVELDLVELFAGDEPDHRRQLRDPDDWHAVVEPRLAEAIRELEAFGPRRVLVTGAMRHPLLFAVGRHLPDVRGWVLTWNQRGADWPLTPSETVEPRVLADEPLGGGSGNELAVAIGLTHDPTASVRGWAAGHSEIGHLLTLGPAGTPAPGVVPGGAWAASWAHAAREIARAKVLELGSPRVHLFFAAPAGVALAVGHVWNMMPVTSVYEYLPETNTYVLTVNQT
jgi:hypothetical protein